MLLSAEPSLQPWGLHLITVIDVGEPTIVSNAVPWSWDPGLNKEGVSELNTNMHHPSSPPLLCGRDWPLQARAAVASLLCWIVTWNCELK